MKTVTEIVSIQNRLVFFFLVEKDKASDQPFFILNSSHQSQNRQHLTAAKDT